MSGFTQTKPHGRRGRKPLSHEERTAIQVGVPAWALGHFIDLADQVGMTMSDLAGLCLVRELNRLLSERGSSPLPMPGYLAKQSTVLPPQPQLLEVPLFGGFEVTRGTGREYLRLRAPRSIVDVVDAIAGEMRLTRSILAPWLILTDANRVRASLGIKPVPVPSDLAEMVASAAALEDLEATLVS